MGFHTGTPICHVEMEIQGVITWVGRREETHCYSLLSFPNLTDFIVLYQVGDAFMLPPPPQYIPIISIQS